MKKNILAILMACTSMYVFGQDNPDRHSSVAEDAWLSCTTSESPNSDRGNTHWIMYDLGQSYNLDGVKAWNYNHPNGLENGIQNAHIDISSDGTSWTDAGMINIPQSNGHSNYNGNASFSFDKKNARYVLLSVANSYGGTCAGLAELKIEVSSAVLPLSLVSFNIECQSSFRTMAYWETENQINIDKFEIIASRDLKKWSTVATKLALDGKENSYEVAVNNTFSDFPYYKLKSLDNDGTEHFSAIVFNDCQSNDFSVGPNPTSGTLNFESVQNIDLIEVYDATGRMVKLFNYVNSSVDLSDLVSGIYYVQSYVGDRKYTNKVVKN